MADGHQRRTGAVAVIFTSARNGRDEAGYRAAAARMGEVAAAQPGWLGEHGVRDADGLGVTISWWAGAAAWRDQAEHAAARRAGRDRWYDWYLVEIATLTRSYEWRRV